MGKPVIHGRERTLILKVLKFFEHEKTNKKFSIPVDQVIKRTCMATGISKATLMRIKNEAKCLQGKSTADACGALPDVMLPTPGKTRKKRNTVKLNCLEIHAHMEEQESLVGHNNAKESDNSGSTQSLDLKPIKYENDL